jgi:hypothetical protein
MPGDPFLDQDPFFAPARKGALLSALDYADRPGQVVRNLLRGNLAGAGRQVGDFLGDTVDAFLPGDLIPEFSRPDDYVSGGDLVGLHEPGFWKTTADIGVGLLTDPLTYLSFGAAPTAAKVAREAALAGKTGVEAVAAGRAAAEAASKGVRVGIPFTDFSTPLFHADKVLDPLSLGIQAGQKALSFAPQGVQDAATKLAMGTRAVFAARKVSPETEYLIREGERAESASSQAGVDANRATFQGLPKRVRERMGSVVNNLTEEGIGPARVSQLDPEAVALDPLQDILPRNAGEASMGARRIRPADDMLQVRAEGARRGPIDPLDSDVGIEGVAIPELAGPNLDRVMLDPERMWDTVFEPGYADRAAGRTLDQAYPPRPFEARYGSGIDEANRGMGLRPKRKTFGPELPDPMAPSVPGAGIPEDPIGALNANLGGPEYTGGVKSLDDPARATFDTIEGHMQRFAKRLAQTDLTPEEQALAMERFGRFLPQVQKQYRELVEKGSFFAPPGIDVAKEMPVDYAMRKFAGLRDEADLEISGGPRAVKERTLPTDQSAASFLNNNPDVSLDRDLGVSAIDRAGQQGQILKGTRISKGLIDRYATEAKGALAKGVEYDLDPVTLQSTGKAVNKAELSPAHAAAMKAEGKAFAEEGVSSATRAIIEDIRKTDPESAAALHEAVFGIGPRGKVTEALANLNRKWKPLAVYGAIIPRISALTRNLTGGLFQEAANPEARGHIGQSIKSLIPNWLKAIDDGIEKVAGWRIGTNEFAPVEYAMRKSGGTIEGAVNNIADPMLREAFKHGVLDNTFVNSEKLAAAWSKTPKGS